MAVAERCEMTGVSMQKSLSPHEILAIPRFLRGLFIKLSETYEIKRRRRDFHPCDCRHNRKVFEPGCPYGHQFLELAAYQISLRRHLPRTCSSAHFSHDSLLYVRCGRKARIFPTETQGFSNPAEILQNALKTAEKKQESSGKISSKNI